VKLYELCASPLGDLLLVADGEHLTGLHFIDQKYLPTRDGDWYHEPALPVLTETQRQLEEYFAGARRHFELPLAPLGTPFQQRVWRALQDIPYGTTTTYGEIAQRMPADRLRRRPASQAGPARARTRRPACARLLSGPPLFTSPAPVWLLFTSWPGC